MEQAEEAFCGVWRCTKCKVLGPTFTGFIGWRWHDGVWEHYCDKSEFGGGAYHPAINEEAFIEDSLENAYPQALARITELERVLAIVRHVFICADKGSMTWDAGIEELYNAYNNAGLLAPEQWQGAPKEEK